MKMPYLAALATLLIGAGLTLGQGVVVSTMPTAEKDQVAPSEQPPEKIQEASAPWSVPDGVNAGIAETGQASRGVFTAEAQYVLWFLASSHESQALASNGVLGASGSTVLTKLNDPDQFNASSGARLSVGYWEVRNNPWVPSGIRDAGVEATFFFVGQRSAGFSDNTTPNLVRPFFDLNDNQESAFVVAAPGLATGGITARTEADLWGAEVNLWKNVYYNFPGTTASVNLMVGIRYLELDERLQIGSTSVFGTDLTAFPAYASLAGDTLQVSDSFAAHNRFYGGQVGVAGQWWACDCLLIEGAFKLGLGVNSEDLDIGGGQLRTLPDGTRIASAGGLLALPSNSGGFHNNKFAQVPELDFKFSVPILSHVTLSTGFSTLYWSRIIRPEQQIERGLDITQIPNFPPAAGAAVTGLGQPGVPFKQSDLWELGISFGVEVNW
jgi:hypothetical protein